MADWRALVEARKWDQIEWKDYVATEQRELLDCLRAIVPKVVDKNGTVRVERYLLPSDDEARERYKEFRGAAAILAFGELEAFVEGEPPTDVQMWCEIRVPAEDHLHVLLSAPEVTKGDEKLSRRQHAKAALKELSQIDIILMLGLDELDSEEDREWLTELVAGIAWHAFDCGRHTQLAIGKPGEQHAVRGIALRKGQQEAAEKLKRLQKPVRD